MELFVSLVFNNLKICWNTIVEPTTVTVVILPITITTIYCRLLGMQRITNFDTNINPVWWQILVNTNGVQIFGNESKYSNKTFVVTVGI